MTKDLQSSTLPKRVIVDQVVKSRYVPGARPLSWDERVPGVEVIRATSGEEISLFSNGGQSSPAPGWELLLTAETIMPESRQAALEWTLYGIRRVEKSA
jgi:hypothetical protein